MKTSVKTTFIVGLLVLDCAFGVFLGKNIYQNQRQETLHAFEIDAIRAADMNATHAKTSAQMDNEAKIIIASALHPHKCENFINEIVTHANEQGSAIADILSDKYFNEKLYNDCK